MQDILKNTMQLLQDTQIAHRNTLNKCFLKHQELGGLKDYLFDVADKIGEYIIKGGEQIESVIIAPTKHNKDYEVEYRYILNVLQGYIKFLGSKQSINPIVRNYLLDVLDELTQILTKLQSLN